jgi:phosphatidylglycerophosphate synthase
VLDPWLTTPLRGQYKRLRIPPSIRPETIVGCGHLAAVIGALGLACSTRSVWGGLIAMASVALNHVCDVLDGTHARATGQCRNGGELLDHFVDPLSFAYWAAGLAASATAYSQLAPWIGMAGVAVILAMAVLTNIRAKMTGQFIVGRFGPTEFKTLLVMYALLQTWPVGGGEHFSAFFAMVFLTSMTVVGAYQLATTLRESISEVNRAGSSPADTTEWEVTSATRDPAPGPVMQT